MKKFEMNRREKEEKEFEEYVVNINRVAKVVKGGRRFSLTAFVVIGDKKGNVGYGSGKGKEVPDAIRKAIKRAKKNVRKIVTKGTTIPYEVMAEYCSAKVFLKPAVEGTGIIAGAAVRAVVEAAGIENILTKSLGSDNTNNIVKATFAALEKLRDLRQVEELRGVKIDEVS